MTELSAENEAFAADRLFGPDPSPRPCREPTVSIDKSVPAATSAVDLDEGHHDASQPADPNAGATRAARWLVAAAAAAAVAIVVILTGGTAGGEKPGGSAAGPVPASVLPVAAPSTAAATTTADRAIAYAASADCPAGSTSARALTDPSSDTPWTCVRGQQGARVDGQVLHVDFGGSYVLSAVSVTPGWVSRAPGARDQWLAHRVVSRLQFVFDDADRSIFTQDTGNARGPVTTTLPHRVLASRVTVIVLQTTRPLASPAPSQDPEAPARPGFGDSLLGPLGAPLPADGVLTTGATVPGDGGEDPVDATFALSELTFLGHQPM